MRGISAVTAQVIVDDIGRVIHENVNFMDSNSYIIASTDRSRIGFQHDGAKKIIEERLEELYITTEMETKNTRKGINLPIVINNKIIGVIGITGDRERISAYGNIVRYMTQIMVEDGIIKDKQRYDRRVRYRFLKEWISNNESSPSRALIERGLELGIDIQRKRRALVIYIANYNILSGTTEGQKKLEEIEATIRHIAEKKDDFLYLSEDEMQILLILACSDDRVNEIAAGIAEKVEKKYKEKLLFGVGGSKEGSNMAYKICSKAEKALACAISSGKEVVFYDNLNIDIFISEISYNSMEEYLKKLFGTKRNDEVDSCMEIISAYFKYDGSITRIAESLYIHKNTLQYRIKKIQDITNVDIRTPTGGALLYIAREFYKKLYKKEI